MRTHTGTITSAKWMKALSEGIENKKEEIKNKKEEIEKKLNYESLINSLNSLTSSLNSFKNNFVNFIYDYEKGGNTIDLKSIEDLKNINDSDDIDDLKNIEFDNENINHNNILTEFKNLKDLIDDIISPPQNSFFSPDAGAIAIIATPFLINTAYVFIDIISEIIYMDTCK